VSGGDVPPPLVQVLGGNVVTAAMVLGCINSANACTLRRLHPAIAGVVAGVPWADMGMRVDDIVRWRAALPAAVGAMVGTLPDEWRPAAIAALVGMTRLQLGPSCGNLAAHLIPHLPPTLTAFIARSARLPQTVTFTHLHALQTLDCSGTDVLCNGLGGLPSSLRTLCIDKCTLPPSADFSHLRALQQLSCQSVSLPAAVVASLPPSLEVLDFRKASWPWGSNNVSLAHLTRLRVLLASRTNIADVSLPASLTELDLSHRTGSGRISFAHLLALRKLNVANVYGVRDDDMTALPPSLESLNVSQCHALTKAVVFPHLQALQTLDVSRTDIGNATVTSMPPGLVTLHMNVCHNVTPAVRMDHLVALRELHAVDTKMPHTALTACRARGGVAASGRTFTAYPGRISALAALADGRLVSGSSDGTLRLWDPERGGDATAELHAAGAVKALAVLPDGCRVAVGVWAEDEAQGGVIVWDSRVAAEICAKPRVAGVTIHRGNVLEMAALRDGRLAVLCKNGTMRVLNAETGAVVLPREDPWYCTRLLTVLRNGVLAVGLWEGSTQLWDFTSPPCVGIATMDTPPWCDLVQLDNYWLVSACTYSVEVFNPTIRMCMYEGRDYEGAVTALVAVPGGQLAVGTARGRVYVWDTHPHDDRPLSVRELTSGAGHPITALLPLPGGRLVSADWHSETRTSSLQVWHMPAAAPVAP